MTWRLLPEIWKIEEIGSTDKLVLLAIAQFTNELGRDAYPAQTTLARMCNCSVRTVKRSLSSLREMGILKKCGYSSKGTVRYTVNLEMAGGAKNDGGRGHPRPTIPLKIHFNNNYDFDSDKMVNQRQIDKFSSISEAPTSVIRLADKLSR
jgi:hypothetical protein